MLIDKQPGALLLNKDNSLLEIKRVEALKRYDILNAPAVKELDQLTELAAMICEVPIAAVSLIDESRQWFKSKTGLTVDSTDRAISICQHTIKGSGIYEVTDALKHDLFKNNPLVKGEPYLRFYAGYPLIDPDGFALGTLCVIDHVPKKLTEKKKHMLSLLAAEVVSQILARKEKAEKNHFEELFMRSIDMVCMLGTDGFFKKINPAFSVVLGWTNRELMGRPVIDFVHADDKEHTQHELAKLSQGIRTNNFCNRYLTKSGEYKVLSWVSNPDSSKGLIYAIARDKTDSIAAEQKLAMAEKKFRDVFENSPDAIFVEDLAGNILDVNPAGAELQGLVKEELIGVNIRNLIPKEKYVKSLTDYKKLFLGTIKTVESLLWSTVKGEIPVEISGRKIVFGNHPALLLLVRDISERKKHEAKRNKTINEKMLQREEQVSSFIKIQEEERNRIATEMHDEVGADLSRISILGQVIKKSTADKGMIEHIDKILFASTKVQENISSIIWAMNPKNDTLENLVAYINYYASEYLETCSVKHKIDLPKNIPSIILKSNIRRNIFLVVKESLNNLVKYSEATSVTFKMETEYNQLIITLTDNGIGFNIEEIPRFHNGIMNMKQRIKEINGFFEILSKKMEGTNIIIRIPFPKE